MKNRIFSLAISLAILFFYLSTASFAQNQPEKNNTQSKNQTMVTNNQKDVKSNQNQILHTTMEPKVVSTSDNKMATNKITKQQATVPKANKNNDQVNKQYHKKQGTTNSEKQQQEKMSAKGDDNKQAK
jgi:cytoskeletal protein RodZ